MKNFIVCLLMFVAACGPVLYQQEPIKAGPREYVWQPFDLGTRDCPEGRGAYLFDKRTGELINAQMAAASSVHCQFLQGGFAGAAIGAGIGAQGSSVAKASATASQEQNQRIVVPPRKPYYGR